MEDLGAFLKKLRGKMSFREAAEKSGLSHSYIRYLENGKRPGTNTPINATPESLSALAKAYHYDYQKLMEKAGYLPGHEQNNDPVDKLIEYLDLELTDDEIIDRMNFKVDNITLTDEEVKQFITFVRWERSKKKEQPAGSRPEQS